MKIWGYILEGPYRPDREKQLEILRSYNVDATWNDKIACGRRGPGSGQRQLSERNDLLQAAKAGDRIIVSDPYCLGISPDDVSWFMGILASCNVSLLVSGASYHIEPGQDTTSLVNEVARRQNAANVAAHRARRKGA